MAPLLVQYRDGTRHLIAQRFPHPRGLLYFEPFWHLPGAATRIHLLEGDLRGEGPWKIGDATVRVLGCHHTDPNEALTHDRWIEYVETHAHEVPSITDQIALARLHGACVEPATRKASA
ncbi:MAG: hypothetical protein KDG50_15100 [Chromatiales bacterium]|nr:hypothetical protein [Chromatiales bacterium]